MTSFMTMEWIRAAGVRALKTTAQTAASLLGAGTFGFLEADWVGVASAAVMAGILSLLTSVAGLPECTDGECEG